MVGCGVGFKYKAAMGSCVSSRHGKGTNQGQQLCGKECMGNVCGQRGKVCPGEGKATWGGGIQWWGKGRVVETRSGWTVGEGTRQVWGNCKVCGGGVGSQRE